MTGPFRGSCRGTALVLSGRRFFRHAATG